MTYLIPVRVLVIDDDAAVCRKVSAWLAEAAVEAVTFTDPAAGLEYARKAFAHVALVDLRLPDADAAELIAALRQASPRMRVVGVAAFPEAAQVIAAVRAGARDILEKPLQPPTLRAALERQLAELGISARSEDDYNRRLGARIRAARTAAKLTLSGAAGACGLSAAQLSHIELGRTGTTMWTLARICSALNTPVAALLEGL